MEGLSLFSGNQIFLTNQCLNCFSSTSFLHSLPAFLLHRVRPFFIDNIDYYSIYIVSFVVIKHRIQFNNNKHNLMKYTDKLLNRYLPIPISFVRVTSKAEIYATVAYSQSLWPIVKKEKRTCWLKNL